MEKDPFKEYLRESEPDKALKVMLGVQQLGFRQWTDLKHLNIWLILPFRILKAKSR